MSPRRAGPSKARFTLWLPDETMQELERLQQTTGKGSIAEVVRDAIEVYGSLLKARDQGVELHFEDAKTGEKGRIWLLPGPPPLKRK